MAEERFDRPLDLEINGNALLIGSIGKNALTTI